MIWEAVLTGIKGILHGIDELSTSDEERLLANAELIKQKAGLIAAQIPLLQAAVELELQELRVKSEIITAEAKSEGFLTRSWRPMTMLGFVGLILWHSVGTGLGYPVPVLPDALWPIMQWSLGGYVVGRSMEKSLPGIIGAFTKNGNSK